MRRHWSLRSQEQHGISQQHLETYHQNKEWKASKDGAAPAPMQINSTADSKSQASKQQSSTLSSAKASTDNRGTIPLYNFPFPQLILAGPTADDLKDQQTELERYEAIAPC